MYVSHQSTIREIQHLRVGDLIARIYTSTISICMLCMIALIHHACQKSLNELSQMPQLKRYYP